MAFDVKFFKTTSEESDNELKRRILRLLLIAAEAQSGQTMRSPLNSTGKKLTERVEESEGKWGMRERESARALEGGREVGRELNCVRAGADSELDRSRARPEAETERKEAFILERLLEADA
ncbi:hypothetical protein ACLOJK_032404 [Asimina triloba]